MVLLLARVVLPSYTFLASSSATRLYTYTRLTFRPDLFARIEATAESLDLPGRQLRTDWSSCRRSFCVRARTWTVSLRTI